ncbi:hypothetical protein VTN00DRAFT_8886 [Thermoascus crustaceus]|uniref:uncharacterized protein n=1 Tax=Thermoascus crustaceus TaxID=5088 RepID=UPI0037448CAD
MSEVCYRATNPHLSEKLKTSPGPALSTVLCASYRPPTLPDRSRFRDLISEYWALSRLSCWMRIGRPSAGLHGNVAAGISSS